MLTRIARSVLTRYANLDADVTLFPMGNAGGFSGSSLWRVRHGRQELDLCLRCWPESYPGFERLPLMHHVLEIADQRGCSFVPVPLRSLSGKSYVISTANGDRLDGQDGSNVPPGCRYWELTRWLPGHGELVESSCWQMLESAIASLAQFHQATAHINHGVGPIPGLVDRFQQVQRLRREGVAELRARILSTRLHPCAEVGVQLLDEFERRSESLEIELNKASRSRFRLQPCVRDVRADHFLFDDGRITGLIDYGALRIDHVAGDLARLLGSLWPRWKDDWATVIEVYGRNHRQFEESEFDLVEVFDRGTTLLAGMNWLNWLFIQDRRFDSLADVEQRMRNLLDRIRGMPSS